MIPAATAGAVVVVEVPALVILKILLLFTMVLVPLAMIMPAA
jgi:hypothetical protein